MSDVSFNDTQDKLLNIDPNELLLIDIVRMVIDLAVHERLKDALRIVNRPRIVNMLHQIHFGINHVKDFDQSFNGEPQDTSRGCVVVNHFHK